MITSTRAIMVFAGLHKRYLPSASINTRRLQGETPKGDLFSLPQGEKVSDRETLLSG